MVKNLMDVAPVAGLEGQCGLLLALLDMATAEWREQLGSVPDEALLWQPFPRGHSIGALILHIADVEGFCVTEVAAGQPRPEEELETLLSRETDQYAQSWPTPPAHPLSWFLAEHDAIRARTRATVAALKYPDRVGRRADRPDREYTLRWLLGHIILHEAYHGGQAVLLSLLRAAE
ncbi:MAG TPA: DinB family protein [Armatimonadota bacterium]|jgi:uncharacterized damage-inducible protein DinB